TVGLQLAYLRGAAASVAAPESRPLPGAAGALGVGQLGLTLGANQSFGPLGNVVFELDGDLRSDGLAQLTLGARGVLGPVAARLSLLAQGADALTFEPLAAAGDD